MKILANDGISPAGAQVLKQNGHELIQIFVAQDQLAAYINQNNIEVLLVRSATKVRKDVIDACPGLKIIGRGGVGMDNIDVEYARGKGIKVINTPAASSQSVAELVMGHLYTLVRHLHDSNRHMPLEGDTHFKELKKRYEKGSELQGKTLGIIGFGRIGQAVAKLAIGVGMKVIKHDQYESPNSVTLTFFNGESLEIAVDNVSKEELLKNSDFITLHVPGGEVIAAKEITIMKDGAALVNTARGGVINEEDLLNALESGKIKYAALDVFLNEPTPGIKVLMNPALSLSPHIGAATEEAQERIGTELAELIQAYAAEAAKA